MIMLTDDIIQNSPNKDKNYKLNDGKGLYILVPQVGNKRWRIKYRYNGKEKSLSLGTYPEISIEKARQILKETRELLRKGHDPSAVKKVKGKMTLSTPVKILRKQLVIFEETKQRIESKKRDIENQLDDVCYELNELVGTIQELRGAIHYLEEGFK